MIYICIPAHNEDRTIGVLLWKVRQVLANFPRDYQILVADDGSTDATAEVLGPYERVMPLVVFRNTERKGYASSLEMLLREAVRRSEYPKRDIVVTLQADFTEDPESIVAMLKRIEAGADVVTGESPLPDDGFPRSYRWARRAARYLTSRRGPEGVSDTLTGLRVYRVLVLKKTFDARQGKRLLTWDGWAANTELLREVQPHSRRTEAMPIAFRPERLQRPRRFDFWATLKQAWGVSRGRSGPLEHVAPIQPGTRERATGNGPGRSRHGTPGLQAVSNGGGSSRGESGQRGRRNGRDSQEQRGREAREGRPRRGREEAEQRPAASRQRAQPDQELRPRRDPQAQESRRTRSVRGRESGAGQEPLEQEARPRRERQQRTRRDSSERRERREQQSEPAPQEIVLQDALQEDPGSLQEVGTADHVAPAPDAVAGETISQPRKRRRRRRGSGASKNVQSADTQAEMFDPALGGLEDDGPDDAAAEAGSGDEGGGEPVKKRRRSRGRRGGRGRSRRSSATELTGEEGGEAPQGDDLADVPAAVAAERPAEPKLQQVQSAAEAPPRAPQTNEG